MLRNPALYGVPVEALDNDQDLSSRRADLIHTAAAMLEKHGLVKYDRRSGALQATDLGRIASHYYVSHGTVAIYNEHLKPTMGEIELCRLFSLSEEFKFLVVRQEEKVSAAWAQRLGSGSKAALLPCGCLLRLNAKGGFFSLPLSGYAACGRAAVKERGTDPSCTRWRARSRISNRDTQCGR